MAGLDELLHSGLGGDPLTAVRFAAGMMLGADDLNDALGNVRGQGQLANAWLHGPGVCWGFGVSVELDVGEVVVERGLACDGAGRFVALRAAAQCVSIPRWFVSRGATLGFSEADATAGFDVLVVACYDACLGAPVPVVADPCGGSEGSGVAPSRLAEGAVIRLVKAPAEPDPLPFPRLRALFGVGEPHADVGTAAPDLNELRRLAGLDTVERRPWFDPVRLRDSDLPAGGHSWVVLARLRGLQLSAGLGALVAGTVDYTERQSLVPTAVLQELLAGGNGTGPASTPAPPTPAPAPVPPPSGPQLERGSVLVDGGTITATVAGSLDVASVRSDAVRVSGWSTAGGWQPLLVTGAHIGDGGSVLTIAFERPAEVTRIRFVVAGTGPAPVTGRSADGAWGPLAGAVDGIGGTAHDGVDFVHMEASET